MIGGCMVGGVALLGRGMVGGVSFAAKKKTP